nr:EOG090X0HLW [Polyphemus pediculus]
MKFRFCGDQDCPDWFLTQMAALSRLSSIKAKLLAQHVGRHLTGSELEEEKTSSLLADSKLPPKDVQSLLASLQFILSSASRFQTSEDHLRAELQQVGLPKEHATALAKVHQDMTKSIRQHLLTESLKFNRVENVLLRPDDSSDLIEMDFTIQSPNESFQIKADPAKLQTLLYELEKVKALMGQHGMN